MLAASCNLHRGRGYQRAGTAVASELPLERDGKCGMAEVLLVEDDEAIGRSLGDALREASHVVRWCRDGGSSVAAAEAAPPPDLVILALGLPDLDGVDVCRAM